MSGPEANLQKISGKTVPKRKAALFRQYMGEIDFMLGQGFSHEEINHALKEAGFDISLAMFRNMLYRERGRKTRNASGSHTGQILQMNSRAEQLAGLLSESGRANAPAGSGKAAYDHGEYRKKEPKW